MAAIISVSVVSQFNSFWWNFSIYFRLLQAIYKTSALMGLRVIYIFSHDSIGLGEDGPTHQPVEQLAGLRSIPNLKVFLLDQPI